MNEVAVLNWFQNQQYDEYDANNSWEVDIVDLEI